ncbi:MAG TPA: DUF2799 domain-containing protein [Burkholderiales bacterium]|nr:DUF2799 domain-containing protein [Burkholderiales bacterium]
MRHALIVSMLLVGGCAGMTQSDCGGANWHELGERDGLIGVPPRIDTYAYQCSRQNVQVSTADYMDGWWIGNATYRDRTAGSESN